MDRKSPRVNRRLIMLYTLEERLEIGRRIYQNEISRYEASFKYGISQNTARDYMRLYRDRNNLPSKHGTSKKTLPASVKTAIEAATSTDYESMTKEELIHELMMAKIAEARLKKGYEVKGDGTVILYGSKNTE